MKVQVFHYRVHLEPLTEQYFKDQNVRILKNTDDDDEKRHYDYINISKDKLGFIIVGLSEINDVMLRTFPTGKTLFLDKKGYQFRQR